jgi:sugar/nucleoside kinase (ribokinase family)
VVDTTGAGDLFAAGFLARAAGPRALERCLWTGAIAAGEVISAFRRAARSRPEGAGAKL